MNIYIYIYICIERERLIYIYIYMYDVYMLYNVGIRTVRRCAHRCTRAT